MLPTSLPFIITRIIGQRNREEMNSEGVSQLANDCLQRCRRCSQRVDDANSRQKARRAERTEARKKPQSHCASSAAKAIVCKCPSSFPKSNALYGGSHFQQMNKKRRRSPEITVSKYNINSDISSTRVKHKNTILHRKSHISRPHKPLNVISFECLLLIIFFVSFGQGSFNLYFTQNANAQGYDPVASPSSDTSNSGPTQSESNQQPTTASTTAACFGGLQTFEKISMSAFENPSTASNGGSFGSGILVQQDDQALTSECVNLCRSQSNCLSFVIDYNKFECKSYATTQQELQQEFDTKFQSTTRSINNSTTPNSTDTNGYQAAASSINIQQLLPSTSSNYFEKICLDGVANRNQFSDVCGQGRLWTIERVVDTFLDGFVEKEVTNVNNKDECSKLCIFETQFVCRSADYDHYSRLCRLSKEDRRTQPQAIRYVPGSNRQYLENQCATPGPSSCVYESRKNVGIISMDALKFAQTAQDCQMKCNLETTFNCRSYSFHQQRCFLSGDDSVSLNSNLIKLPVKQGWLFGEKKCLVELCTRGIFSYEKITGYTLRSALSTSIDLMMPSGSSLNMATVGSNINNLDDLERIQHAATQTKLRHLLPAVQSGANQSTSNIVSTMMMMAANGNYGSMDPMHESASSRHARSTNNLAITEHCRHSCDLGYLNCPAFTIDYKNNRCQRLDRNSQGRHQELVARDGYSYYEKICLRVPEIMSMCQDKYWIFERVIGYELAPRLYDKSLKFVQSRRDCEEYCLEEKQFQCRSALYNDETSDCKLSRYDRRLALHEGGYYRNFNVRISYLENQCVRDHKLDRQCYYEQTKDEPAYPTFTERIEMAHSLPATTNTAAGGTTSTTAAVETEGFRSGLNATQRFGSSYCEQLCNDNAKFECHSFGFYASTAQCFLSGDDSLSAGDMASTPSTGFTYYEKKCRLSQMPGTSTNLTDIIGYDGSRGGGANGVTPSMGATTTPANMQSLNPYLQVPNQKFNQGPSTTPHYEDLSSPTTERPPMTAYNSTNVLIDQQFNMSRPHRPSGAETTAYDPDHYKCGLGHSFAYQRISGFEPIGGYLTLLAKNNDQPGIVAECSEMCKRAYECRAFVIDYNNNQCHAMLENSSVGLLSLRQTLGKDYFEGFCVANHLLLTGSNCRNKLWIVDKIVDQAVVGVQHQKLIPDSGRAQCRLACLEERLFWCKSAMFDSTTGDCKLYSIDRESMPQMHLLFTRGVDFFENQCQISSNLCPYDAIERDMTIITVTKSIQARSTFDCELACNTEMTFNCRSYTYLEQYPSLPNICLLSSDSRSTSQKGSVKEHARTLYAERNCYYRRPRHPGGGASSFSSSHSKLDPPPYPQLQGPMNNPHSQTDPYHNLPATRPNLVNVMPPTDGYTPSSKLSEQEGLQNANDNLPTAPGQAGCEPHQYTFERTFGYDFKLAPKERAPIAPTIGISIGCQLECQRRGARCQSFVVDYALPYQSCFLIETQVGANKRLLVKSANSAYFEKVCIPRTGIEIPEPLTHSPLTNQLEPHSMDISPSYSSEPWSPQVPNQLPYYLQQQQLVQNYPSRTCAKLWSFERFVNHNFTAPSDRTIENQLSKTQCEAHCLNEASFSCRAATYDYTNKICRLFKSTRRTIMSQFVDIESPPTSPPLTSGASPPGANSHPGTAHVIGGETEPIQAAASGGGGSSGESLLVDPSNRRQSGARQLATSSTPTAEPSNPNINIDYMENTCSPEPSSCQYRQLYDQFSPYIDKVNHAISLSDCQRQCDQERLFSCKSINYDPISRNCMLVNEDLISLNRGQQASLLSKKNTIYSEKGNCEMISVQCNSHEMLVSINFDSPFRGRVMAKGNPEQCYMIGDGQTSIRFPIVFGPKCNSRQEGHNTFVNEVVVQQHPVIMTESDKTVRVMCAFEAPDQTITLKNPTSGDNKTAGIDVGTPESSRTRHDKQQFNSVVSNKASPPSVVLRILDQNNRDASMINLGDELTLRIQMQMDGQNSALGIFARNLAARSSNGESLLLIDNDGCPVDHQVFPGLEVDPKDGKSLYSSFKAFRFPSSGLVNFEVQIRFCPERCQPVDCHRGGQHKLKSYGRRRKRDIYGTESMPPSRIQPILQSVNNDNNTSGQSPIEALSTVMRPGKAFEYVRKLMLSPQNSNESPPTDSKEPGLVTQPTPNAHEQTDPAGLESVATSPAAVAQDEQGSSADKGSPGEEFDNYNSSKQEKDQAQDQSSQPAAGEPATQIQPLVDYEPAQQDFKQETHKQAEVPTRVLDSSLPKMTQGTILMHVDEKIVPSTSAFVNSRGQSLGLAPYGRYPASPMEQFVSVTSAPPGSLESSLNVQSSVQTSSARSTNFSTDITGHSGISDTISTPSTSDPANIDETSETGSMESSTATNSMEEPPAKIPVDHEGSPSSANQGQLTQKPLNMNAARGDLPLRFSILVGENQPITSNGWAPINQPPVVVMNSTNVDLDHIVIPGKDGQIDTNDLRNPSQIATTSNSITSTYNPASIYSDTSYQEQTSSHHHGAGDNIKRNVSGEQTFDALSSNSITSKINMRHQQDGQSEASNGRNRNPESETAASHDCQIESGKSRLRTIIWTGTIVIALNVCLVILSLVLYFRKVHLRHNHTIVRTPSDCGTQRSNDSRWPSVLLKSKSNLGTSLNTHEHFFCKLNSKTSVGGAEGGVVGGPSGLNREFHWPNLSSSSSHSTVSSLASPLPTTNIRIAQMRPALKTSPFDSQSSLRSGNFNAGHHSRTVLDINSCEPEHRGKFNARYTNNIDELHSERF